MTQVPNGSTTDVNDLAVTISLAGTGAIATDTVRLYNGTTLIGTKVLDGTDISNGFAVISFTDLVDSVYDFNATITTSNGTSARSADYIVTVDTGSPPPPDEPNGAVLLFNEEFDALDLKSDSNPNGRWRPNDFWQSINRGYIDFAGTNWNANPNESAVNLNPFGVAGSVLTIYSARIPSDRNAAIAASVAAQGQSGVPTWYGGMLITNVDVFSYRYGYIEGRMRWPNPGKGMFPAFWLYNARGGSKTAAEIDILEIFGDTGNSYHTSIHGPASYEVAALNTDTNNWHTYGLDWQPTYLHFYRDRALVAAVTGPDAAWFDVAMCPRINFAMNAPWFPNPAKQADGSTPSPMLMEVDYVKVWDKLPF